MDREIAITIFPSLTDVDVVEDNRHSIMWSKLAKRFQEHTIKNWKNALPMFIAAEMTSDGKRCQDDIESYSMIVLDFDEKVHYNWFISTYNKKEFVLYTSYNHLADDKTCKFRVCLPLVENISADEYREAKPVLMSMFPDADPAGFSMSQAFFLPGTHWDNKDKFFSHHQKGEWLNFKDLKMEILLNKAGSLLEQLNRSENNNKSYGKDGLDDAAKLLDTMDPDCGYDTWWKVGACLKTLYGDDAFELWFDWSSTGASYDSNERGLQNKWNSFSDHSPYCFGFLVNRSREYRRK